MKKTLSDEIYEEGKLKERATKDYNKFQSLDHLEQLKMIKDNTMFVICPADSSGRVPVMFFPDYLYNWFEDASTEFYEYCINKDDKVYEMFIKVYNIKRGH